MVHISSLTLPSIALVINCGKLFKDLMSSRAELTPVGCSLTAACRVEEFPSIIMNTSKVGRFRDLTQVSLSVSRCCPIVSSTPCFRVGCSQGSIQTTIYNLLGNGTKILQPLTQIEVVLSICTRTSESQRQIPDSYLSFIPLGALTVPWDLATIATDAL